MIRVVGTNEFFCFLWLSAAARGWIDLVTMEPGCFLPVLCCGKPIGVEHASSLTIHLIGAALCSFAFASVSA
jgi:hypothetical protein